MDSSAVGSPSPRERAKPRKKDKTRDKTRSQGSSRSGHRSRSRRPAMAHRKPSPSQRSLGGASSTVSDNAKSPAPHVSKTPPKLPRTAKQLGQGAEVSPQPQPTHDSVAIHVCHQGVAPAEAGIKREDRPLSSALENDLPHVSKPLNLKQASRGGRSTPFGSPGLSYRSLEKLLTPSSNTPSRSGVAKVRKSRLSPTFIAVLGVIIAAILAITSIMAASPSTRALTSTCTTFACKEFSQRLRASLNTSVNPCVSFTRFVCDGWQQRNLLDVWDDIFLQMLRQINWTLRSIEWPLERQNDEHRAAAVYQSCNDVFLGRSDQLSDVKRALKDAGVVWPLPSKNADALHTLLYCSLRLGWGTLLDFRVEHSGESTALVISEGQSAFIFQHSLMDTSGTTAEKKDRFEFLKREFNEKESDSLSYELISSYDYTISRVLRLAHYRHTVLENAEGLNLTGPRWPGALTKLNVRLHPAPLMILTTNFQYLEEVVNAWNEYGEGSFHSLISWCTVQIAALYANRYLILNHYGWHERTAELYHTAFCVSRAAFFAPDATFARYNRQVLSEYGETKARETALSVRSTVFHQLSSWPYFDKNITVVRNWSSAETMFRSFDQVQEFVTIQNGSPVDMTRSFVENWKRSVMFSRTPAVETFVRDINYQRFYSVNEDDLDFQLAPYAFYYPLFDTALPMSVNYGGLGDQVATALGDFILEAFEYARASQVDAFYDCLEDGPYGNVWDSNSNAAKTLTLRALIQAYLTSGYDGIGSLPGFERYSGLQTLFIARCYADCQGSGVRYSEDICNFDLQYTPEFAEAFNCFPGDPMIAPRRCRLQEW